MRWLAAVIAVTCLACSRTVIVTDSGVQGKVVSGPTCPVERLDSPCPNQPESALIKATRTGSDSAAGVTRTDGNGAFKMTLAPGSYTVTAQAPGAFGGCKPQDVTVSAKTFAHVVITCDTGIR
ncbi:MAG: hypothetical protein ABR507_00965 [Actinomycetota bacterium]